MNMFNPSILPIGNEWSVERKPVASSMARRWLVALAVAVALTTLSGQVWAETPAVSATASATKGVGAGQMTSDGRDFSALTEKDVKGLVRAEKEKYYAWKEAQLDTRVITEEQRLKENGARVIETWKLADKAGAMVIETWKLADKEGARVVAKYTEYIDLFNQLHAMRWKPGFDEKAYNDAKDFLRKTLLKGIPPEILPRLEKMRDIITA